MYKKVALGEAEAHALYNEELTLEEDNRITLKRMRYFQEFLGAAAYTDDYKVISKGRTIRVGFDLPAYIPARNPLENWFQVAMRSPVAGSLDPLNLKARYKGFLPCFLIYDTGTNQGWVVVEVDTDLEFAEYALFIYDRADYGNFIDEVQKILGQKLDSGIKLIRDRDGNTIMISDSLTNQAMMLMPLALLNGGKEYARKIWREVIY